MISSFYPDENYKMFTFYNLKLSESSSIKTEETYKSSAWNFKIVFSSISWTIPIMTYESFAESNDWRQFTYRNLVYGI